MSLLLDRSGSSINISSPCETWSSRVIFLLSHTSLLSPPHTHPSNTCANLHWIFSRKFCQLDHLPHAALDKSKLACFCLSQPNNLLTIERNRTHTRCPVLRTRSQRPCLLASSLLEASLRRDTTARPNPTWYVFPSIPCPSPHERSLASSVHFSNAQ